MDGLAMSPLINLAGVSLMLKEANQFGETLSATDVAILFTRSNAPTEVAEGGGALTYGLDSCLVLDNDALFALDHGPIFFSYHV